MSSTVGLYVAEGSHQTGELAIEGRIRIDGSFAGKIYSEERLDLGQNSLFEGDADVAEAEIAGTFIGNIRAREKLWVLPSGNIQGFIDAGITEIAPGGQITGEVRISGKIRS